MVSRVALIILLLLAKRVWWILEQPVTSCMPSHPVLLAIQHLAMFPFVDWAVADTTLGAFGAPTIKHVRLYSNKWWVHGLSRSKPPFSDFAPSDTTTRETVINNQGVEKHRVTGAAGLKKSQAYPDEFGKVFLDLYVSYVDKLNEEPEDAAGDFDNFEIAEVSRTAWQYFEMGPVPAFLAGDR